MRLALGDHHAEGRHILRDHGACPDVSVPSDAAKLMHRTERADVRKVLNRDVPGERRAIDENRVARRRGNRARRANTP